MNFLFNILFLFFTGYATAQMPSDTLIENIALTTTAQVNQGTSYITFPTDIGNIEALWFEANLNYSFYIRTNKEARLVGVLTPQIIIRMYQEESFPVRTPSYIPQITAYYRLNKFVSNNSLNFFAKIAHHSNGQDEDFYLDNGTINTKSGNFTTNYMEIGFVKTNYNSRFNAAQFFSTSIEIHSENLTADELIGQYSLCRWNTLFSVLKIPEDQSSKNKKANISIKSKTVWMFGDVNNWDFFSWDRLNLSLTFFYHPKFLEDIGFFAQIYHGMDYYNIYFNHQISVLRFGIMTEKLKF